MLEATSAADTQLLTISLRKLSSSVAELLAFRSAHSVHAFSSVIVLESHCLLCFSAVCFSMKSHLELLGLEVAIGFPCIYHQLWPGNSSNNFVWE